MKDFHALLTLYLIWHATELCWRYVQSPKIGSTFTNSMQNKWFPDRFVSLIQGCARDWPRERKGGLICKSSTKSYLFFYARLECIDSGLIICNVKLSTFQLRNSARFSKNLRFWRNATHNFLISAKNKNLGSSNNLREMTVSLGPFAQLRTVTISKHQLIQCLKAV